MESGTNGTTCEDALKFGITRPSTSAVDMRDMPGACPWCSSEYCGIFHMGPCPERNKIRLDVRIEVKGILGPSYLSVDRLAKEVEKQLIKTIRKI